MPRRALAGGIGAVTVLVVAGSSLGATWSTPERADPVPPTPATPRAETGDVLRSAGPVPGQRVRTGALLRRQPPPVVPPTGPGAFTVADVRLEVAGTGDVRYSVEVEQGLPFDRAEVAREVDATLADGRGWAARLGITVQRVESAPALRILLATPGTTDALCAPLDTAGRVSCRNGGLVVVNAVRWAEAVPWYADDVAGYRTYVVNHEVGHFLGRPHRPCPARGLPAPVMQQQTYGLQGCLPSVWPSPDEIG